MTQAQHKIDYVRALAEEQKMFVTQEQRKMERITTQDIVNREKNKLERLKQDEEDEEDVGLMGKILGFFSGKKSNRESPQKSKILL